MMLKRLPPTPWPQSRSGLGTSTKKHLSRFVLCLDQNHQHSPILTFCASDPQALIEETSSRATESLPEQPQLPQWLPAATACVPRAPLIDVDEFPIHGKAGHELSWSHFDLAALQRDGVWMQPSHGYQAGKGTTVFLTAPLFLHANNTRGPASQVSSAMDGVEFSVL